VEDIAAAERALRKAEEAVAMLGADGLHIDHDKSESTHEARQDAEAALRALGVEP
jgi:hypothetical protein